MTAKDARKKSSLFYRDRDDGEYGIIMNMINKAALRGEYRAWHGKDISEDVKKRLESDGYKFIQDKNSEPHIITISWHENDKRPDVVNNLI